ncbi:MAG: hypothetical protein IJB30_08215 [Clostridia bacterium]|nr:hypothetical protein [Clostridia bacterium]
MKKEREKEAKRERKTKNQACRAARFSPQGKVSLKGAGGAVKLETAIQKAAQHMSGFFAGKI